MYQCPSQQIDTEKSCLLREGWEAALRNLKRPQVSNGPGGGDCIISTITLGFCVGFFKVGSWASTLEIQGCESLESLLSLEEQQVFDI